MRTTPSGMQWTATLVSCAVGAAMLSQPSHLPAPFRTQVDRAIDCAARVWLWTWDEASDDLQQVEMPPDEWELEQPGWRESAKARRIDPSTPHAELVEHFP